MVLVGIVNKDLVGHVNRAGVPALGLCGEDGDLILARPRGPELGFVGDVTSVNVELLTRLMDTAVPVLATVATDGRGQSYNVNADDAAAAVATALGAAKLVLMTDVPGVLHEGELVSELAAAEADGLIEAGIVTGGMVPKLRAASSAIAGGVPRVHIVDGRVEHALILELFTPEGMGTMLVADGPQPPAFVPAGTGTEAAS
jgi:acetylglutamate kinase